MRPSASTALENGRFSDFLAAPIGEEKNGMTLSLLSAFTRLGVDPWQEAARLAGLPETKAVAALAAIIVRANPGDGDDPPSLAARLLRLLPRPDQAARTPDLPPRRATGGPLSLLAGITLPPPETLRWLGIAALLAVVLLLSRLW